MRHPLTLLSLLSLSACVAGQGTLSPSSGTAGEDQVCAARLAAQEDLPMSAVRVNSRDESPVGNSIVFIQVEGGGPSAVCEVDAAGTIVDFRML